MRRVFSKFINGGIKVGILWLLRGRVCYKWFRGLVGLWSCFIKGLRGEMEIEEFLEGLKFFFELF